jgi:hypothetical protein
MYAASDNALKIVVARARACRVLAEEDVWPSPVVAVVAVGVVEQERLADVVVLVDEVGVLVAAQLPVAVEHRAVGARPAVADDLDIRVARPDRVGELRVVGEELDVALLVAERNRVEPERLGVAERGAHAAPVRGDAAVGELDQIERVLDERGGPIVSFQR